MWENKREAAWLKKLPFGIETFSEIAGETYYYVDKTGLIKELIELKDSESGAAEDMDAQCQKALQQIREKKYGQKLLSDGMRTVLAYGIACNKKQCRVAMEMLQGGLK